MDARHIAAMMRQAVLGDPRPADDSRPGRALRPAQREAVARISRALGTHGGALLADAPGSGKTVVALEVARTHGPALVVAPAVVRSHWRREATALGVPVAVWSFEQLSRAQLPEVPYRLLVVDEAQHAGAASTRRRTALVRLARGCPVLLLSATPVRNRLEELTALLGLFLPAESCDDPAVLAECIVRRDDASVGPERRTGELLTVPDRARLADRIRHLPPPFPLRDGGLAPGLVTIGLLRARDSSLAALVAALSRRAQRGRALESALQGGEWPTARELRRWLAGDDGVQLQLPFATRETTAPATCALAIARHCDAVRELSQVARSHAVPDAEARAARIIEVMARHPGVPVLAFTQHAATARALYQVLRRRHQVILITASGAWSASGRRSRDEVLTTLEPGASAARAAHDRPSVVIATDLLSEGVNLQRAGVVIHLDLPWTPARLRQRLGRVARLGSPHAIVHEYFIVRTRDGARTLAFARRHREKRAAEWRALAPGADAEALRRALLTWPDHRVQRPATTAQAGTPLVGRVAGRASALLALVEEAGIRRLVAGRVPADRRSRDRPGSRSVRNLSLDAGRLAEVVASVQFEADHRGASSDAASSHDAASLAAAIQRWLTARSARRAIGGAPERRGAGRRLLALVHAAMADASPRRRTVLAQAAATFQQALAAPGGAARAAVLESLWQRAPTLPTDVTPEWVTGAADEVRATASATAAASGLRACGDRVLAMLIVSPREEVRSGPAAALPAHRDARRADGS